MKTIIKIVAFIFAALSVQAAPVRVTFDAPVARGDVLHQSATINYLYTDSEHLDLYTSLGTVRMCYPPPAPNPDPEIAAWESDLRAATCQIQLTSGDVSAPAITFIKQTVPARFKAWAEGK